MLDIDATPEVACMPAAKAGRKPSLLDVDCIAAEAGAGQAGDFACGLGILHLCGSVAGVAAALGSGRHKN